MIQYFNLFACIIWLKDKQTAQKKKKKIQGSVSQSQRHWHLGPDDSLCELSCALYGVLQLYPSVASNSSAYSINPIRDFPGVEAVGEGSSKSASN